MSKNETYETKVPQCIGFIPDGNRRWARSKELSTLEGHKKGGEKLREVVSWCKEAGIKHVAVYAFSTENWKRSEGEVAYLTKLLETYLKDFDEDLVSLHFIGQTDAFGEILSALVKKLEEDTGGREYHLYVALSYGGRAEILEGIKKIAREKSPEEIEDLTEEDFRRAVWSADMPDPDLIIRTSGEERLSNFLTWQSVYSELAFVKTHWPDFSREEFFEVLKDYQNRDRRRGK